MDYRKNKVYLDKRLAKDNGTANVGKRNLYKTIADTNKYYRTETVEEKISKLKDRIRFRSKNL